MNENDKISSFLKSLLKTNRTYDYFVCWENIILNNFDVEINAINCLINKQDDNKFKSSFYDLLNKTPSVILLFPYLIALSKADRESMFESEHPLEIIKDITRIRDTDKLFFDNAHLPKNTQDIENYYIFFCRMGLKSLYQNLLQRSTYDYIIGILVGLDTNGRKNRGGKLFEEVCKPYIKKIADRYKLKFIEQKSITVIKDYGCTIPSGLRTKRTDFILINPKKKKCIDIEVNFYNGTGSKPEEIIDSYITRSNCLKKSGNSFALITDGFYCWNNAQSQIQRGFQEIQNIINYSFLEEGALDEIVKKELL